MRMTAKGRPDRHSRAPLRGRSGVGYNPISKCREMKPDEPSVTGETSRRKRRASSNGPAMVEFHSNRCRWIFNLGWRIWGISSAAVLTLGAAQDPRVTPGASGREQFEALCANCHGGDGAGGELGPDIVHSHARERSLDELRELIVTGISDGGMPPTALADPLLGELAGICMLRRIRSQIICTGTSATESSSM